MSDAGEDALIEYCIEVYYRRMVAATEQAEQQRWCELMSAWVKKRSPERVVAMEQERGLSEHHDSR